MPVRAVAEVGGAVMQREESWRNSQSRASLTEMKPAWEHADYTTRHRSCQKLAFSTEHELFLQEMDYSLLRHPLRLGGSFHLKVKL